MADSLPPLAWLARVDPARATVTVSCGPSVRREENGFFEGTWVGPGRLAALPSATTVFGSGVVIDEGAPLVITPAHAMSGVFAFVAGQRVLVSNSLVGLLCGAGMELTTGVDYPGCFVRSIDGVEGSPLSLPATAGTVGYHYYWNLRLGPDCSITQEAKPREAAFVDFHDYRSRLSAALGSALANAGSYEPVVSLSTGYDSTAVAVLAAEHGCTRALTLIEGRWTKKSGRDTADSGEQTATRLGMKTYVFDRLAYTRRDDLPEAEFLATGMSGEDVVMADYEPQLHKSVLLTGTQGNGVWRVGGSHSSNLSRSGLDGGSLNEFRLRADFAFVPLPVFGLVQRPSVMAISASPQMKPWSVGKRYDQPISRRIAEEAGLPRGSFAVRKHAVSALIHAEGMASLAPQTAAAVGHFAEAEGIPFVFPRRFTPKRIHRAALRLAPRLGAGRLVRGLKKRRRRLVHFEPEVGSLLLRWAISVIRPRYQALDRTAE